MARIPIPTPDSMSSEQRRVYDAIVGLRGGHMPAPYQTSINAPELTDKWQQLGELLRYRTGLSARLSELAVLVVARHHDCQYVWQAHAPIALKAGVTAPTIEAIRTGGRPSDLPADEAAIYGFATTLLRSKFIDDAIYAAALRQFGAKGVVELTCLLGYYVMVAMSLNAHGQSSPPGAGGPLPAVS